MTFDKFIQDYIARHVRADLFLSQVLEKYTEENGVPKKDEVNQALIFLLAQNGSVLASCLIQYGIKHNCLNVNLRNPKDNKRTLLMYAAIHRLDDLLKLLLSVGADKELVDAKGKTALWYATHPQEGAVYIRSGVLQRYLPLFGKKIPEYIATRQECQSLRAYNLPDTWEDDDQQEIVHVSKKIKKDKDTETLGFQADQNKKVRAQNKKVYNYTEHISTLGFIEMIEARGKNNDFPDRFPKYLEKYYQNLNDKLVSKAIPLLALKGKVKSIHDLLTKFPQANIFKVILNNKSALDYLDELTRLGRCVDLQDVKNELIERFAKNSNMQISYDEIEDDDEDEDEELEKVEEVEEDVQKVEILPQVHFIPRPIIPEDLDLGKVPVELPSLFPALDNLQIDLPQGGYVTKMFLSGYQIGNTNMQDSLSSQSDQGIACENDRKDPHVFC